MNKLSSSEKLLLYILLLVATCVICLWFALMPTVQSYNDLKTKLDGLKQEESNIQIQLAQGRGMQEKIDEMIEKAEIEKAPFLTVEEKEILQRWIVEVAENAGLKIKALSISDRQIVSVIPYIIKKENESYPIGEYYITSKNNTEGATVQEIQEEIPKVEDGGDKVIKTSFNIAVSGNKADVIQFADTLSSSKKHILVENLPLPAFDIEEDKDVSLSISIYSIARENDGSFNRYRFE